jgi:putative drug exporter of the RND superfamily
VTRLLYRLGRTGARHPYRVIACWLLIVAAIAGLSTGLGGVYRDAMTVPGTSSDRATQELLAHMPDHAGAEAHVIAHWPGPVDRAAVNRVMAAMRTLPAVRTVSSQDSPDHHAVLLTAGYRTPLADLDAAATTATLTSAAMPLRQAGAHVAVGGQVPESVQGPNGIAESVGVGAALIVLVLAFGSALAAGLPLAIAFVGVGAGLGLIALLAAVVDVNTASPTLGSMIGLGVGIDYALFIVARHRDGLAAGLSPVDAAATATATAGRSVVFAGVSVLIGITGLVFSGVTGFASMGLAAALVVLCAVATSITLAPSLLRLIGIRAFGRKARRAGRLDATSFRSAQAERLARAVSRRPARWLLVGIAVLIGLAVPAAGMRLGQNDAGSERPAKPTRQAYDMVAAAFGPGANGPLTVVVNRHAVTNPALVALHHRLADAPDVASVSAPAFSPDGGISVMQVVPATGPQDSRTTALVHRLHTHVLPRGADVTGPTAAQADLTGVLGGHLLAVVAVVLSATALLLIVMFRSPLVAVKAVLVNLLSVAASYGVMRVAFQTTWGAHLIGLTQPVPIAAWAPMVLFAILFGLSMDYEVFMLSRARESYERTGEARTSVVEGLASTARIITSAGSIMIVVALGFAFDTSVMVKIIGVGMASAIFVDVTVARLILVPAAMALLGERAWSLPRGLDRLLPRIGAEASPPATTSHESAPEAPTPTR